jgi:hypothetical protein
MGAQTVPSNWSRKTFLCCSKQWLVVDLIVFAVELAGAFAGRVIKQRLPKHHLTDDAKSIGAAETADRSRPLYLLSRRGEQTTRGNQRRAQGCPGSVAFQLRRSGVPSSDRTQH